MAFRPNAGSISRSWAFLSTLVPTRHYCRQSQFHAQKGYDIVIFGDREHPEVIGLLGYADGRGHGSQTKPISSHCPLEGGVAMVSQSTMFTTRISNLSAILRKVIPICSFSTPFAEPPRRQSDLVSLVEQAGGDCGDRRKGIRPTQETGQLAAANERPTFSRGNGRGSRSESFLPFALVGVTAGASTSNSSFARFASAARILLNIQSHDD